MKREWFVVLIILLVLVFPQSVSAAEDDSNFLDRFVEFFKERFKINPDLSPETGDYPVFNQESDKIGVNAPLCTDSDGGRNIYVKGTTIGTNGGFRDKCGQVIGLDYYVREYTCRDGEAVNDDILCPGTCCDGKCVANDECVVCYNDADCHADVVIPPYCDSGELCQGVIEYSCVNPGTDQSQCVSSQDVICSPCPGGEVCENGACVAPESHLECQSLQCIVVAGPGADECSSNPDCFPKPECGDGNSDAGEECDDGDIDPDDTFYLENPIDDDGMCVIDVEIPVNSCLNNVCGDGYLDLSEEQCDDNNLIFGDGCSDECELEAGPTDPICGNGGTCINDLDCDSDNNEEICSGGFCIEVDADGIILEQCDDGNSNPSDLCSNSCEFTFCGDSLVQNPNGEGIAEQCDDGNSNPLDGCDTEGINPDGNGICTLTFCGDSLIQQPNGQGRIEQCDDGNIIPGDGCDEFCEVETTTCEFTNAYWSQDDVPVSQVTEGEFVDLTLEGVNCQGDVLFQVWEDDVGEGDPSDEFIRNLQGTFAGNVVIGGKGKPVWRAQWQCDGEFPPGSGICFFGNPEYYFDAFLLDDPSVTERSNLLGVSPAPEEGYCGDSVMQQPNGNGVIEECDDGDNSNQNECTNECTLNVCGDGYIRLGFEACDDGNNEDFDGCSADCELECEFTDAYWSQSGIEVSDVLEGELVDLVIEGNLCDGYDVVFEIYEEDVPEGEFDDEFIETKSGTFVGSSAVAGVPWTAQWQCDGDDGSGACLYGNPEYYFDAFLSVNPTMNERSGLLNVGQLGGVYCGDGDVNQAWEQCDDGNNNDNDACTNSCMDSICGDSVVFTDGCVPGVSCEECDDGNSEEGDLCSNSCEFTFCGDSLVQNPNGEGIAEQCDDGNNEDGDGCSALCGFEELCTDVESFVEEQKLLASDGSSYDFFGTSVSIDGDRAVIGAQGDDDLGSGSGSAYIFRYDGVNWIEEQKLLASDGVSDDLFGESVSISGDTAVIGAQGGDDSGSNSGSAYIFRYDGVNWIEEQKLLASDGQAGDFFGSSVSISGDTAVIGAYGDDDSGSSAGSAYIFRYDFVSGTWIEEQKLLASDGQAGDFLGISVSIDGDTAVIGAYKDDDSGSSAGSAYIFRYDSVSGTWTEEQKLLASDGDSNDFLGLPVSIDGDTVVIGAYGDDDSGSLSGSAYVFRYDGVNWIEEQKLLASDGVTADWFGYSVSIDGDTVVIGAQGDDDLGGGSGSAYVFRYDGVNWIEEQKLLASDGGAGDVFGTSVSIDGDTVVIGAHGKNDFSGSAYVYRSLEICTSCGDGVYDPDGPDDIPGTLDDEQCDDGDIDPDDTFYLENPIDDDGQCVIDQEIFLNSCKDNVCGDGYLDVSSEECEDRNSNPLDECDMQGSNPDGNGVCSLTFCGDSLVQQPNGGGVVEQCDDGNAIPDDGCNACQADFPGCFEETPPLDIMIVMDTSGSMSGDKIENAKIASNTFVSEMDFSKDTGGLTSFTSLAILEQTLINQQDLLTAAINSLFVSDGTYIAPAIETGRIDLVDNGRENLIMILLSDGWTSGQAQTVYEADIAKELGIIIFTIGIGESVNSNLLTEIASQPDYFYYAPDSEEIVFISNQIAGEICVLPTCGNGNPDPGEQCDDGNNENGDGCSASCELE